jgi:hypothetical protein
MQLPSKEEMRPWLNRGGLAFTVMILVVLAYIVGHRPKESPSLLQPVTAQTPAQGQPNPAEQRAETQRGPDLNNPEDRRKLAEIYRERLKQLQAMDQEHGQPDQPKQQPPAQPKRGLAFDLTQGTPEMLDQTSEASPNAKGEMKMPERKKTSVPKSPRQDRPKVRRPGEQDRFDPNRPYRYRGDDYPREPPPDRDQDGDNRPMSVT